jgi:hypothetical protein
MQFGQFGHDFDEELSQMGKNIEKNLQFGQLSQDMDRKLSQFDTKNFQFDRVGQDIDKQVNKMGENLGKHMNTLGNQMGNQFEHMGNQFEHMGNQFGKLGDNLEKQFSNMQSSSGTNRQFNQYSEIENAIKIQADKMLYNAKEKCVSAGHSEVAVPLENTFTAAYQCVKEKVNVENVGHDFSEAMRTKDLTGFNNKMCRIWLDTYHCVKPIIVTYEKCLSSNKVDATEKSLELVDISITFFCENDASRMTQFIEQDGFKCFENNQNNLQSCITTAIQNIQQNSDNSMVTYDEEGCNEFNDLRRCLVDRLRTCPSQTPADIIDDYLRLVSRKACNSAPSIAWFSFVNIILLLSTYLYSKIF